MPGEFHKDSNAQWHFDLCDWQEAFELFYRRRPADPELCLVISTDSYTSGYWVERNAKADSKTHVYRTVKAATGLESRVRKAISKTVNLSLGQVIF